MALDPRELDQLMSMIAIKAVGSSESGIKVELYGVLKEFFEDSNSWREDIRFTPVTGQTEYPLTPLNDGQIIRLEGVFDTNNIPVAAYMPTFGVVNLRWAPQPAPAGQWWARVVKTVTLPTTKDNYPVAPDWVLKVYSDVIMDGVLGNMLAQVGKSYTNPQMSAYHLKRFRTGIQLARTAAIRQNLVGGQEWAYPRQGMVTGSQKGGVSTAWPTRAF